MSKKTTNNHISRTQLCKIYRNLLDDGKITEGGPAHSRLLFLETYKRSY